MKENMQACQHWDKIGTRWEDETHIIPNFSDVSISSKMQKHGDPQWSNIKTASG